MFLNASFGQWAGAQSLASAIASGDSFVFMDGLMMQNDSLITVVLMGLFIAMFMTMIPALVQTLFNVKIPDEYYKSAKNNLNTMWKGIKKGATLNQALYLTWPPFLCMPILI